MFSKIIAFMGVILITKVSCVHAGYLSDVESLYTKLLSGYNKNVRPLHNTNTPIFVNLTFNILNINEFDEVKGKCSVGAYFEVLWMDSRMTWDPSQYNSTLTIEIPQTEVWIPRITVANPYDKLDCLGKDFMTVQYHYNGLAVWLPGDVISFSCFTDDTYFPFDEQNCVIWLLFSGLTKDQVILLAPRKGIGLTFYMEHGTWKLLDSETRSEIIEQFSFIKVYINMKRIPAFYVINIMMPIIFMVILNLFVFILPVECGDRLSYAITVLLALAVFLTLVGEYLPKTSEPMSLLSYFLLAVLIMSSVTCMLTIVGLNIYYKPQDKPIPRWVAKSVIILNSCKRKGRLSEVIPVQGTRGESQSTSIQDEKDVSDGKNISQVTWVDVSNFLDKVMIVFHILAISILSSVFFWLSA